MTTWTMEQVTQARGLYQRAVVDTSRPPEQLAPMRDAVASKMARAMIQAAHPFAIEMHPGDLVIEWKPDETRPWTDVAMMAWRPSTTEVEMRGGQADGQRMQIQRVGDPIKVAVLSNPLLDPDADQFAPVLTRHLTYELAGWHEAERVWVYEIR